MCTIYSVNHTTYTHNYICYLPNSRRNPSSGIACSSLQLSLSLSTPFDETTKIAQYSQKSHSNAFQLFSKHRNDLTPFKLFPRLILFQLIQPVDNLLQHCRSNGLFNIGILYGRTGNGRLEHMVQAWENNGLHLSVTIL